MADPKNLPKAGATCACGANYYFERGTEPGDHGHFHCIRCGRRYAFWCEGQWEPGRVGPADEPPGR